MQAESLQTPVGRVNFVDLRPPMLPPGTPTHVIDSGWGGSILPMAEQFADFANETKSHLVLSSTQLNPGEETFPDGLSYACQLSRAAFSLNYLIDEAKIKKPVLVGYSKAAPVATIAGLMRKEAIAGLILVNPASLIGRDTAAELIGRFMIGALKTTTLQENPEHKLSFSGCFSNIWRYALANGLIAYREVQEMSVIPLHKLLLLLKERGVPRAVLSCTGDLVFSSSRMRAMIYNNGNPIVEEYEEMNGDHGLFISKPHDVMHRVLDTSKKLLKNAA